MRWFVSHLLHCDMQPSKRANTIPHNDTEAGTPPSTQPVKRMRLQAFGGCSCAPSTPSLCNAGAHGRCLQGGRVAQGTMRVALGLYSARSRKIRSASEPVIRVRTSSWEQAARLQAVSGRQRARVHPALKLHVLHAAVKAPRPPEELLRRRAGRHCPARAAPRRPRLRRLRQPAKRWRGSPWWSELGSFLECGVLLEGSGCSEGFRQGTVEAW